MEILWWLAPTVVVTVLAMLGVAWLGRAERGQVDREQAAARLGQALRTPHKGLERPGSSVRRERSTGVAVRRTRPSARTVDDRRSA